MIVRMFSRYFKYNQFMGLMNSSKTFSTIHNKHFEYFRVRDEYKDLVVPLNHESNQANIPGSECSFLLKGHTPQTEGYLMHLHNRENVMKLTPKQVKDILILMANIKVDTLQYSTVLKYLDEKCAIHAEKWPLDLSLLILDAWFIIWGSKAFRKPYYSAITGVWGRRIKKCPKNNLILMLYLIGLSKVSPPFLMESIEVRMENFIDKLSDEELAIACLSFFKTSKRVESELILTQSCKAAENLLNKDDRFNAIGILKCLRLSKYYDPKLWTFIKKYALKESKTFNFVECTNFLAIFAAQNIYDEELFNALEADGLSALLNEKKALEVIGVVTSIKTHPSLKSRVKDIARFVWAMGSVGHSIKNNTLEFTNNMMKHREIEGELETQTHVLVDYLQSLALVGCYPRDTLQSVLNKNTVDQIYNSDRAKPKYQLYFVQRSTQIEEPELEIDTKNLYKPIPKSLERDVRGREGFQDMVNILRNIPKLYTKICYLMPHIMISGIIVGTKRTNQLTNFNPYQKYLDAGILSKQANDVFQVCSDYVCVEVFDSTVCASESEVPLGLMKTKIRQLQKLNFKVVTLSPKNINELVMKNSFEKSHAINELFELN